VNPRLAYSPILASDAISGSGQASVAHAQRRLLAVDDDRSVRNALWVTFRELYTVTLADSGPQAIQTFREQPADVALLDIRMPGMSGLEVLKEIKRIDPAVEVILLTGYETIEYVREAMRLGASEYITKPYVVDELRLAVENAMARREASRKAASYANRLTQLQSEMHQQQMREELARTRNEIYASIIHDVNSPLTAIAGYVEMIQNSVAHAESLESDQLVEVREYLQAIARNARNCIDLSGRYLGFLQGAFGASSKASVNGVFGDLSELLKAYPKVRTKELLIRPLENDAILAIHRIDLLQVLLNLTINALQCSPHHQRVELSARLLPPGAAKPLIQSAPGVYFVRAADFDESAPSLAISVRDSGPGIPENLLPRIFESYFTTKPPGQGSGLGLAIVQRLVITAHGVVHVYSHPGEGSVFTICIPLLSSPSPDSAPDAVKARHS